MSYKSSTESNKDVFHANVKKTFYFLPMFHYLPRDLSSSFYKLLKTFIFARAWAGSASE